MDEQATPKGECPSFGRISVLRPLWWILQSIIIGVWEILLAFVLIWQFLHILATGERHAWSREFTSKYIYHLRAWIEYTFWTRDEQPKIIEY